jgi:hypothetical protein
MENTGHWAAPSPVHYHWDQPSLASTFSTMMLQQPPPANND